MGLLQAPHVRCGACVFQARQALTCGATVLSLGTGGVAANEVGGFFGNHDGGGVGIAGGDAGHDGSVDDT